LEEDKELKEECPNEANVVSEEELKDENEKHEKFKKEHKNKFKMENIELKKEIENLKFELLKNRADLENFKKRQKDESIKDRIYANQSLILELLTPLEYLDKACNFQTESQELKNFLIGFQMIDKQLFGVLESSGLKEINAKKGDLFDPVYHHALDKEHVDDMEPGVILEVLSKGYTYKERVIKPVSVKVSE
jgi:molecular chaperone GrpE